MKLASMMACLNLCRGPLVWTNEQSGLVWGGVWNICMCVCVCVCVCVYIYTQQKQKNYFVMNEKSLQLLKLFQ
jgi:hypothetical protein